MLESEILDHLPIGLIVARGDAIQFMNHTLRSLFAGEFTSLADLASAFPTTAALSRSVSGWRG
jgi:hypothetical protein